jgi:transposase InsO family protein
VKSAEYGPAYAAHEARNFGRLMGFRICTTHPFNYARTAMEQLPRWFEDYNENHPHKSLKMRSPREYRKQQLS